MRVLITFAVEAEFAPWRQLRKFQRSGPNGLNVSSFATTIENNRVEVVLTGIGRAVRDVPFERLAFPSREKPDLVISTGFAGALSRSLAPGDVLAPQKVRTLGNEAYADADPLFRTRAIERGALPIETLITVDRVVQTASEKPRLAFFGQAVDMESAVVMSVFAKRGVPTMTVRVVSDAADEDLPIDFDRCLTPQGAVRKMSLVNAIVRRPGKLPNLIRFGRQSSLAAQKLASFLDQFLALDAVPKERIAAV